MRPTEHLTRYTANFIDELVLSGLEHVVISPGSRSTPLAILAKHHPKIKEWILVDERSAAFFALGIAKATAKPVALICTSGTAAANYYPAIVEASMARVPLLVMTADRPHELRDVGAPQAIDQIHLYGRYVKDFQEMALPDASQKMLHYVRQRASRVVRIAQQNNPGPVHVNFPFREPLMPEIHLDHLWGNEAHAYNRRLEGKQSLSSEAIDEIIPIFTSNTNGLIVCGPQSDEGLPEALVALAEALGVPVIADPLSQLRTGNHSQKQVIATYDALLRDQQLRQSLQVDYIIRFGAMPISKSYRFFVEDQQQALQFVVEHGETVREPTNHNSRYIFADSTSFCQALVAVIGDTPKQTDWLDRWLAMDHTAKKILTGMHKEELNEGETVRAVCESLPENSVLFAGNSMPIRDLDTFLLPVNKQVKTTGNRGASGIDGITSTALGMAAASSGQVTLIIGDLSFYHDLNGLFAAKRYKLSLRIILLNNNGGGIFSYLPQANDPTYFEALFGTPLDMDFEKVVSLYDGNYSRVTTKSDFHNLLQETNGQDGLHVMEVVTNREENVKWHKDLWSKIAEEVAMLS